MKKMLLPLLLIVLGFHSRAQVSPVFAPDGRALKGYDVVAFFTLSKPVMGYDSLAHEWNGVRWLFSSNENRNLFAAAPEKYAPQYGGYCAYGTAEGHKAPTEVETWTIVENKLYFNYNKPVQRAWKKNQPALIEKADRQWPVIKDKE
ncbi:MAG: YHS domain protein [Chitinophagaceae bacterium]|nr:MAG: YHS domain protein [Chitinophagaceae bacterium]